MNTIDIKTIKKKLALILFICENENELKIGIGEPDYKMAIDLFSQWLDKIEKE